MELRVDGRILLQEVTDELSGEDQAPRANDRNLCYDSLLLCK
jgi:hypothetical protein